MCPWIHHEEHKKSFKMIYYTNNDNKNICHENKVHFVHFVSCLVEVNMKEHKIQVNCSVMTL